MATNKPEWRNVPSAQTPLMLVLDAGQSRIKAIVKMHQGSFYFGLAYAGREDFAAHNYTITMEKAKERAEALLKEQCEEILKFSQAYFGLTEWK
jgi:hypothetical protein